MRVCARTLASVALVGGLGVLTGCGSTGGGAAWHGPPSGQGPSGQGGGEEDAAATVAVTSPANGAADVPTSTELALTGPAAAATKVTLADAGGTAVEGSLRPDSSAWVPATQLKYGTAYTATVTGPTGQPKTVGFTTMAKPKSLTNVSANLADNTVYGVAMPIVVTFGKDVAADQRANVEKRLFVTSEPAQLGVWHWFSGREVHFRPKEYWQTGTTLSVRLATGGLPMSGTSSGGPSSGGPSSGSTSYGSKDVTVRATIGEKVVLTTDDAAHTMTVAKNDQVVKTIPVSLGKASTPSSSGAMVIMAKNQSELFVSTNPADPYRETVYWTQRITGGGEYVHAAPWSEGDQGKRNVSHGCTNVSTTNAKWLFGLTRVGDAVIVKGTPRKLAWGNGWTDWNQPWEQYVKGSALPAPTAG